MSVCSLLKALLSHRIKTELYERTERALESPTKSNVGVWIGTYLSTDMNLSENRGMCAKLKP